MDVDSSEFIEKENLDFLDQNYTGRGYHHSQPYTDKINLRRL